MTSIERTAYPRFKRLLSARELHAFYTPSPEEMAWARESTDCDEHLLALVVWSRCFHRLGHFPPLVEVPVVVTEHVRRDLGLASGTAAVHASSRTAKRHRDLVRQRYGVVWDPVRARMVAGEAIREAAWRKNNPPDLINIALERLVEGSLELPGFSTLDRMASRIRLEVNTEIVTMLVGRVGPAGVAGLRRLLVVGPSGKSDYDRLKRSAPRPSWTNFRLQLDHLRWVDSLGDAPGWVAGITASKLADFAGEAEVADAAVMGDYGPDKQVALLATLVHAAQTKARDDVAEMFCRRVATLTKRARKELEDLKAAHREVTERLVANYRVVLERLDPDGPADAKDVAAQEAATEATALRAAREAVRAVGGFAGQYADIDRVSAHHGDNHTPLVARHFRHDRAAMLAMVGALQLEATSADRSVLASLDFVRQHAGRTRDHVADQAVVSDETGLRCWAATSQAPQIARAPPTIAPKMPCQTFVDVPNVLVVQSSSGGSAGAVCTHCVTVAMTVTVGRGDGVPVGRTGGVNCNSPSRTARICIRQPLWSVGQSLTTASQPLSRSCSSAIRASSSTTFAIRYSAAQRRVQHTPDSLDRTMAACGSWPAVTISISLRPGPIVCRCRGRPSGSRVSGRSGWRNDHEGS